MDRQEEQLTIWSELYPYFKLKEPVILLEMFAGIGAQRKALSILNVKIDETNSKICEWAYNSYCGYNAIHIKDKADYSVGKTKEELVERIKGTSINYNEPLTIEQLYKKPLDWLRNAYNNCEATHNLINIMDVKGSDLGELPKEQTSILTYSFPCQDLSLAGKRAGMETSQAEGGTRSGLLWEIERILLERFSLKLNMPTILIMENVPEVVGKGNINHFKKWEQRLREFGYSNYVEILNGKNYGIPQNRKRCFMISILGEYAYDFPCKIPLKYKLKDLLENNVDEKYYLSQKMIDYISATGTKDFSVNNSKINCSIGRPLTTEQSKRAGTTNYIGDDLPQDFDLREIVPLKRGYNIEVKEDNPNEEDEVDLIGNYSKSDYAQTPIVGKNGIAPTFTENHGQVIAIAIKNATEQGYLLAEDGDGVDISTRMETHRGTVQKGSCQTLTTQGGENVGVVVKDEKNKRK